MPIFPAVARGARSRYQICKQYAIALAHGSKYVYQTMPRMLTVWLDAAEDPELVQLDTKRQNG
jgi:serine/threonine-protein kinase ATR